MSTCGDEVSWKSGERTFSMKPQGHSFRFTETRPERNRETGEVAMKEFELGVIHGGIYVEVRRLVGLAEEEG